LFKKLKLCSLLWAIGNHWSLWSLIEPFLVKKFRTE